MTHPQKGSSLRSGMAKLMSVLYQGGVIAINTKKGQSKKLCFCTRGEVLPDLGDPDSEFQANHDGLYMTLEVKKGNAPISFTWGWHGNLDELPALLALVGDPEKIIEEFLLQNSFRVGLNVPLDRDSFELNLEEKASNDSPAPRG